MPADLHPVLPPLPALTAPQRTVLLAAKAWWQEGERSLDYFAENARQETALAQIHTIAENLRFLTTPTGEDIAPLLRLTRQVTGNRLLNRTLATDDFAEATRALLFGEEPLPDRLAAFLARPLIGPLTTSHLLFVCFPARFPLVSPQTRAVLAPTVAQVLAARLHAKELYHLTEETPIAVRDLLADFTLYASALSLLQLSRYTELNAVLSHAGEAPRRGQRQRNRVRETPVEYGVAPETERTMPLEETLLLETIEYEIAARGFTFPPLTVRDYYIALKAKPFVLLTGLSGTGKTRLTRLLADAITGGSTEQYLLVAVRPDWHDSTGLLGFHNLLTDRYSGTPFLEILHRAAQPENQERSYFLCLDEMNLAKVEHYFAEVLSAMETDEGRIHLYAGRSATLAPNVFLTGSVNMDEATHPFSRKVLDRANIIEFTDVDFRQEGTPFPPPAREISGPDRQRLFLNGRVRARAEAERRLQGVDASFPDRIVSALSELNALLTVRNLHFGYRVRDEILCYSAAAFTETGKGLLLAEAEANLQTALDLQIVQKVLPRVTGTSEALARMLADLEAWSVRSGFPRTTAKLNRMRRRADEEGFVSFYEG